MIKLPILKGGYGSGRKKTKIVLSDEKEKIINKIMDLEYGVDQIKRLLRKENPESERAYKLKKELKKLKKEYSRAQNSIKNL